MPLNLNLSYETLVAIRDSHKELMTVPLGGCSPTIGEIVQQAIALQLHQESGAQINREDPETTKRRQRVIEKICEDVIEPVTRYHRFQYAGDCICGKLPKGWNHTFEDKILGFIIAAVKEKMDREGPPPSRYADAD